MKESAPDQFKTSESESAPDQFKKLRAAKAKRAMLGSLGCWRQITRRTSWGTSYHHGEPPPYQLEIFMDNGLLWGTIYHGDGGQLDIMLDQPSHTRELDIMADECDISIAFPYEHHFRYQAMIVIGNVAWNAVEDTLTFTQVHDFGSTNRPPPERPWTKGELSSGVREIPIHPLKQCYFHGLNGTYELIKKRPLDAPEEDGGFPPMPVSRRRLAFRENNEADDVAPADSVSNVK